MPALYGVYTSHPVTTLSGIWIDLSGPQPGIVGISDVAMLSLIPATGTAEQKRVAFQSALNSNLQHQCDLVGTFPTPPVFGIAQPG